MRKLFIISLLACPLLTNAQQKFVYEGRIEYERKINIHRQFDDEEMRSEWFKEFVKRQPAFHNSNFTLDFKGNQSIYKINGELAKLEMPSIIPGNPSNDSGPPLTGISSV